MKILWAIDAFEDSFDLEGKTIQTLRGLGNQLTVQIDPVYVLSPDQLGVTLEFSEHWANKYEPNAKLALDSKLKGLSLKGLRSAIILRQDRSSLRATVEKLTTFAEREKYDLLVVASHGKKGLERVALGSFAEQLLMQSKVPVLVVGHHSTTFPDQGSARVLIPSDLSHSGSPFFTQALRFAKSLKAQTTLMSVITHPIEAVIQSGVFLLSGGWVQVPVYLEAERTRLKEAAAGVCRLAQALEVECEWKQIDGRTSVAETIADQAASTGANLIVMQAESGPVASVILGSVTRQLVRIAPCPVLVFRAQKAHEVKNEFNQVSDAG
jgi:nucleotide-binding universal stress UspA family protein